MAWNPKARYILISARACIECFPDNFTKMILHCACCEFLIALICPASVRFSNRLRIVVTNFKAF